MKGNVDIDAIGSGLQVNQRGHILVDGGGKIITHPVETSDTYSVVAERRGMYMLMQALMANIQVLRT